jgi:hypothetical protein
MKNFFKLIGIAALVAVIGFSLTGCPVDDDDYEMLNGVWDRGDIVVTITNSTGVFTTINPNSGWYNVLNNGEIRIGGQKFRNIRKVYKTGTNLEWACEQRTYNRWTFVTGWEDCRLTMSKDGKTLQSSGDVGIGTYTRE